MGDKVQLSQILLNVYRNAIQAMTESDSRKIFVSVGKQDDRIVLRVRDTGIGLVEALKPKIGMPFVTTKTDGLGVGLSISKSIAEKHSGRLTITNAIGGGVLVELNLPAEST
jgi:C4-dicarboxylate-specific signal transduction histidine kinase